MYFRFIQACPFALFMKSIVLFIFSFLFLVQNSFSQDQKNVFGLGLHTGVSHSGWNTALCAQYQFHDFNFYIGPELSLNRGLPAKGPIGLDSGIDWILRTQKERISALVNLDYQLNFYPSTKHTDVLHEINLSFGFRIKIWKGLYLVPQTGYGFYSESVYIESTSTRKNFQDYNGLLRLRVGYAF